ncbi:Short-chain dehydrogenase/reductase SDR [Macrophomina phaseolina MS6]|uniref:Short-chain dehydrogenase/reductase SDR n=1 Tax=Macrophomina phaseolina (strain MS6) TaxID=1126212 RepID=K2SSC8_MACPH|nr:Short-chain dehydrogenase/reductase SDR [Macrophomina phaseolina MS6]
MHDGVRICIADCNVDALEKASSDIQARYPRIQLHTAAVDVSQALSVQDWIATITRDVGPLDLAANIAGVAQAAYCRPSDRPAILQEDAHDWRRIMSVNLDGVFHCTKAQVQAMLGRASAEKRSHSIVNMSSLASTTPVGDFFAYGASKAALAHFSVCVAKDVWKFGIRVNTVSPAATSTAMIPVFLPQESGVDVASLKLLRSADVADVVKWLLSDESRNISGINIAVGGAGR